MLADLVCAKVEALLIFIPVGEPELNSLSICMRRLLWQARLDGPCVIHLQFLCEVTNVADKLSNDDEDTGLY